MIGKAIGTKDNETEGGFFYDWNFYCPDIRGAYEYSGSIQHRGDKEQQYVGVRKLGAAFRPSYLPGGVGAA